MFDEPLLKNGSLSFGEVRLLDTFPVNRFLRNLTLNIFLFDRHMLIFIGSGRCCLVSDNRSGQTF